MVCSSVGMLPPVGGSNATQKNTADVEEQKLNLVIKKKIIKMINNINL